MTKRKKFKTVLGYLRSHGDPDADRERKIINALLPQVGVDDTILPEETPREGVERLLQVHNELRAVAALRDCIKWIDRPKWTVTGSCSTVVRSGMIFRGVDYTAKETESLETICRERKVSMSEAVEIMRDRATAK